MASQEELIDALLDLQVPGNLHLSKNSQELVYTAALNLTQKTDEHPVSSIWHAQVGRPNSARQLTSGIHNDKIPQISPDGKAVAFVSDRAKQGESSAIYILSLAEGGEAYPITSTGNERTIESLKWSPKGNHIAFLSADEKTAEQKTKEKDKDDAAVYGKDWPFNRLHILDVTAKTIETTIRLDKHISEFDWHPDDDKIAFVTQRTPEIESYYCFERSFYVLSASELPEPQHLGDFACGVQSITYARDAIYFVGSVSQRTPVGSFALFKIDVEKPSIQKVAHGDTNCCTKVKNIDGDLMISIQNGLDDELELVGSKTILKLPCEIGDWEAGFPEDSDELIIALTKSDINTPNEVHTTTASGGAMVKLSNHGASISKTPASSRFISCKSSDDETDIQAVLFTPENASTRNDLRNPLPTVLYIHGGPYSRNTDRFNPSSYYFAEPLLESGYALLQINYRGSSGRGEDFAAKARGAMGSYDYSDVISMTNHCIESGYIDKARMIISGWSQGGFLTYLSSVRNGMHNLGWKFKAAIAGAGVTDWDTMTFASDVGLIQAEFAGASAWTGQKDTVTGRNGSAIWEFKKAADAKIMPPILILHGKDDVRVPVEQARAFRRALEHYNLPFELVEYPREGHTISERKHLEDMIKRFTQFCDRHLTLTTT